MSSRAVPGGKLMTQKLAGPGVAGGADTMAVGEHKTGPDLDEKLIEIKEAQLGDLGQGHAISP
jgi:hypothetical protein